MKSIFDFRFVGDSYLTVGARHVAFGMVVDHKHA